MWSGHLISSIIPVPPSILTTSATGPCQSPCRFWRMIVIDGYQGVRSPDAPQRQHPPMRANIQVSTPSDAARCAIAVSTVMTRSSPATIAAVSVQSSQPHSRRSSSWSEITQSSPPPLAASTMGWNTSHGMLRRWSSSCASGSSGREPPCQHTPMRGRILRGSMRNFAGGGTLSGSVPNTAGSDINETVISGSGMSCPSTTTRPSRTTSSVASKRRIGGWAVR